MRIRHQEGTSGSHGFETPDRTCLLGVRTVLHDLTGLEHKIVHAYNVSVTGRFAHFPVRPESFRPESFRPQVVSPSIT